MFQIRLYNVGPKLFTVDVSVDVVDIKQAEIIAKKKCQEILGVINLSIRPYGDGEYGVLCEGRLVGSFSIR